jgi:predicted XRE-type DNA-binding protein
MAERRKSRRAPEDVDLGPDNIYAEFGMPDAEERQLKASLVTRIRAVILDRKLTQTKAGELMGIPQPKVSELVTGAATGFSAERLIRLLNALGVSVSIALHEEPDWRPGTTFVHFGREPDSSMVESEEKQEPEKARARRHATRAPV